MEDVHVMQGQHVDEAFHRVGGEEMTRNIEMQSAVGETRRVVDGHCRKFHLHVLRIGRDGLAQCLHAIESTGRSSARDLNAVFVHCQTVAFRVFYICSDGQANTFCGIACLYFRLMSRSILDIACQKMCHTFQFGVPFIIHDGCR